MRDFGALSCAWRYLQSSPPKLPTGLLFRGRHAGVEKRGAGGNLKTDTPPKKGFQTPLHLVRLPLVCSQFYLFAIFGGFVRNLAECSEFCLRSFSWNLMRKSITLLVGRGGLRGTKIMNKHFVNKLAFPKLELICLQLSFLLAVPQGAY